MAKAIWPYSDTDNLEFDIYTPGVNWNSSGGLYIFTYSDGKHWQPLYIGQAEDFSDRFSDHERWDEAVALGATHVHAVTVEQEAIRDSLEQKLISYQQPPLNIQHR